MSPLYSLSAGESIKPTALLASLALSDVIDMLARLKAAETVWSLLIANGMSVEDEQGVREAMHKGQMFLQQEAEERFKVMRGK